VVVSLCIGLRYQVSVEVEVDDDVLAGVGVDPGEGELVRMTSFFLFGVAGLHLSFRSSMINSWADQLVLMEVVDRRAAGCKTGKGEEEHRRLFSPRAPFSRHQASPEGH